MAFVKTFHEYMFAKNAIKNLKHNIELLDQEYDSSFAQMGQLASHEFADKLINLKAGKLQAERDLEKETTKFKERQATLIYWFTEIFPGHEIRVMVPTFDMLNQVIQGKVWLDEQNEIQVQA